MNKKWQRYEGRPNRVAKYDPAVTLNEKGVLLLNGKAFDALEQPKAVALVYDEDERVVGIVPTDPRNTNAFPVVQRSYARPASYRLIHANPFCKHFGIKVRGTVRFHNVEIDNEGVMLLPLRYAVQTGRGMY